MPDTPRRREQQRDNYARRACKAKIYVAEDRESIEADGPERIYRRLEERWPNGRFPIRKRPLR